MLLHGKGGKRMTVAIKDWHISLEEDSLPHAVQTAIDKIDDSITDAAPCQLQSKHDDDDSRTEYDTVASHHDCEFSGSGTALASMLTWNHTYGDKVSVYWPLDEQRYTGTNESVLEDGSVIVQYDDGDIETLDLSREDWKPSSSTVQANTATPIVINIAPGELRKMLHHLDKKLFLKHQAEGFGQYNSTESYSVEKESFLNTVEIVHTKYVPIKANVVHSHVLMFCTR